MQGAEPAAEAELRQQGDKAVDLAVDGEVKGIAPHAPSVSNQGRICTNTDDENQPRTSGTAWGAGSPHHLNQGAIPRKQKNTCPRPNPWPGPLPLVRTVACSAMSRRLPSRPAPLLLTGPPSQAWVYRGTGEGGLHTIVHTRSPITNFTVLFCTHSTVANHA